MNLGRRNMRLDAAELDARIRIPMLRASYVEHCKRRGWDFVSTAPKAGIKHIIAVMQRPRSSTVSKTLFYWRRTISRTIYSGSRRTWRSTASRSTHFVAEGRPREENQAAEEGHRSSTISFGNSGMKKAGKLPPCLNSVCSDHHFFKDCPMTSDDLNKNLVEENSAKRSPGADTVLPLTGKAFKSEPKTRHSSASGNARGDTCRTPWPPLRVSP